MEGGCKCRQTFSRSPATHPPTPRASRFLTGTVRLCGLGAGDPCSKVRLRKWGPVHGRSDYQDFLGKVHLFI